VGEQVGEGQVGQVDVGGRLHVLVLHDDQAGGHVAQHAHQADARVDGRYGHDGRQRKVSTYKSQDRKMLLKEEKMPSHLSSFAKGASPRAQPSGDVQVHVDDAEDLLFLLAQRAQVERVIVIEIIRPKRRILVRLVREEPFVADLHGVLALQTD